LKPTGSSAGASLGAAPQRLQVLVVTYAPDLTIQGKCDPENCDPNVEGETLWYEWFDQDRFEPEAKLDQSA